MMNRYYLTLLKEPTKETLGMLIKIRDVMFSPDKGRISVNDFDMKYKKQVTTDTDKEFGIIKQNAYKTELNVLIKQLEQKIEAGDEIIYVEGVKNIDDIKEQLRVGRPSTKNKLDELVKQNIGTDQFNELVKLEKEKPKERKRYIILTTTYSRNDWFNLTNTRKQDYRNEISKNGIKIPEDSFYNFDDEETYYDYLVSKGLYDEQGYSKASTIKIDPSKFLI